MNHSNGNRLAAETLKNNHNLNNYESELEQVYDSEDSPPTALDELTELRSLLLGIEEDKLDQFYEKLDNPQLDVEDISSILPEAFIRRTKQDDLLSEAMVPNVEKAIQSSVNQDINVLSQAIYPIIAPATRKAIASVLHEMIQSFNQALEHSVSPQSLKWRIEAQQTGKSFAEVVLLRTMIYRVEQVFLIHRHSGLMLNHIVAPEVAAQDPSLVSAMLSAIQDFVRDSFDVHKDEGLHTLQFGELTIWIEEGPEAVLAGTIRGNAPGELRLVFQNAIEKIHLKLGQEIHNFSGDTESFEASKPYLEVCLKSHYRKPNKGKYVYAWTFVAIVAMLLGSSGFYAIRENIKENQRWHNYLESLEAQPGITITQIGKKDGKAFIAGMRDPLAIEPPLLMKQAKINPNRVIHQWKPFISLSPKIILKRAAKLLQKPQTVTLSLENNGVLTATGYAPRWWILSAREKKSFLSLININGYEEKNLKELDIEQLDAYKKEIENMKILFQTGKIEFMPGEQEKLLNIVPKIKNLIDASRFLKQEIKIEISGHTDTTGIEFMNIQLSQGRAKSILNYLTLEGIDENYFKTKAFGSQRTLRPESTPEDKKLNRRVSFKVMINDVAK